MDADKEERKTEQEKMAGDLLERMDAEKVERKAYIKLMVTDQQTMKAKQEDLLARMDEINGKMDTTIQSIRSEVQETIHNRVENVREELDKKTEALHIEITDEIQTLEVSIDKRTRCVEEDIAAIKEDITKNKKQMEQVKAIAERGGRQIVGSNTAQAPTFDGKTSWSTFRRQFETVAEILYTIGR
jgi:hypothetical protein